MAVAAERVLDDWAAWAEPVLQRRGPERRIFTLNCTDGLNLAIKGVIRARRPRHHDRPGAQLGQPAVAALETAGVITLTRIASAEGYVDPEGSGRPGRDIAWSR